MYLANVSWQLAKLVREIVDKPDSGHLYRQRKVMYYSPKSFNTIGLHNRKSYYVEAVENNTQETCSVSKGQKGKKPRGMAGHGPTMHCLRRFSYIEAKKKMKHYFFCFAPGTFSFKQYATIVSWHKI